MCLAFPPVASLCDNTTLIILKSYTIARDQLYCSLKLEVILYSTVTLFLLRSSDEQAGGARETPWFLDCVAEAIHASAWAPADAET